MPDEIVIEALSRYQQGIYLTNIARDMGVDYHQLLVATESGRKVLRRSWPDLSAEVVESAMARWNGGETLTAIAIDMQINYNQLVLATAARYAYGEGRLVGHG